MKKIVTFGELMLRLTPPHHEVILQTPQFVATFGGAEANVAVSLANYKENAAFVTALPENSIGEAAVMELRKFGVDTSMIAASPHRMGVYYTQTGSNMRGSKVIYDRDYSAIALAKPSDFDWDKILDGADWFHVTGITPAISESLKDITLMALAACRKKGITVSCDLNYRAKLWKWGKSAREVMPEIVQYVDVLIANEEDCQTCLGIKVDADVEKGSLPIKAYQDLAAILFKDYPNVKYVAVSLRESVSADHNNWSGVLASPKTFSVSPRYTITDIVDRIGGGDSFGAGLIYGLRHYNDQQKTIDFAAAASALKHTTYGDYSRMSLAEVESLMKGNTSGRVVR
jgi:2-dehydro-3-deoxygluconokinase